MADDTALTVQRIIRRDDLLALAADADQAIDIVRSREDIARRAARGQSLFEIALNRQLKLGKAGSSPSLRAQAWNYAAVLLTFSNLVGVKLACDQTAEELHEQALRALEDHDSATKLDRDLAIGVIVRHHAARCYRLAGAYDRAQELAKRPKQALYGTGAEPYMGHYLYELGATLISMDHAHEVARPFSEWESYWAENVRAQGFLSRHRYELIRGLALWHTGAQRADVHAHLVAASEHFAAVPIIETARGRQARELSLALARADFAAEGGDGAREEAIEFGLQALELVNQIRARWSVVARSKAPLALIAQRIYGDLASLAARLPGQRGAELGLRSALSAKQTGFAARIRDGLALDDSPTVRDILDRIVEVEAGTAELLTDNTKSRNEQLSLLRGDLADAVSPMLADTVFPSAIHLEPLIAAIGPRYALDYVELRDSLDATPHLFRTLIRPGGRMRFERCAGVAAFRARFTRTSEATAGAPVTHQTAGADHVASTVVQQATATPVSGGRTPALPIVIAAHRDVNREEAADDADIDWKELAGALLPDDLVAEALADPDLPARLLISGHSWLSRVAWPALAVADDVRLVERAVIAQTPILTCLSGDLPPRVAGKALIRLVGLDEKGVDVTSERRAWDLGASSDGLPPHECDLASGQSPRPRADRFDTALASTERWQFLHVAAHGTGEGFDQLLAIPKEPLSAARALGIRWPASVLMASCHVGLVLNENEAEPLSLVMSLLTGGASCVVAGIDRIDDLGTGEIAATIVNEVRAGGVSLDVALWRAQLSAVRAGMHEEGWALLTAYVR